MKYSAPTYRRWASPSGTTAPYWSRHRTVSFQNGTTISVIHDATRQLTSGPVTFGT